MRDRLRAVGESASARIARAASGRVVVGTVGDAAWHRTRVIEAAMSEASDLGVTVVQPLKYRPGDDKVVLLCRMSDGRRAVFKYLNRQAPRGVAHTHGLTLSLASASGSELFPRCWHVTAHSSLEEYVDGASLKRFTTDDWDRVDLIEFFRRLRAFSRTGLDTTTAIREHELQLILERYLGKSFHFLRYHPPAQRVRSAATTYRRRQTLRPAADAFIRATHGVEIDAYAALDDLHDANLVYSDRVGAPLIIDVEDAKPGVLGFDCAWLLMTMAHGTCPAERLVEAAAVVFSPAYLSGEVESRLAKLLFCILLRSGGLVRTGTPASVCVLLEAVEEELRDAGALPAPAG